MLGEDADWTNRRRENTPRAGAGITVALALYRQSPT
jgi:hypothetical protein